jgi:DNA-binding transcriptional LysR family regulator
MLSFQCDEKENPLTLQQLRYFLAAAEHRSFTAAAAAMRVAQPSLSEQVRLLEAELGVQLFVRAGRSLTLTEAGRALSRPAHRAVAAVAEAELAVAAVRDVVAGTVTLGVFGAPSYYLVGEVIAEFRRRYPRVRIRFVGANSAIVAEDVRAGRVEAGLVVLPVDDAGLDVRPVRRDELLYASARLARVRRPVTIAEVAAAKLVLPFATHAAGDPTRRQIVQRAQEAGLAIEPVIDIDDLEVALDLAARGVADTVISKAIASSRNFPQGLGTTSFDEPIYETLAFITRRETVLSPAMRALLRVAERQLGAAGDG